MNDKIDNPNFPRLKFEGPITLITNDQELMAVKDELLQCQTLGFDTETKPSFKKGDNFKVALLQLATDEKAYLIRLHYIQQFEPIKLILENQKIQKIGLAIRDDIKTLQKLFPFTPNNFIELQDVAKKKALKNMGLKGMAEEVLSGTISKKAKLTNWETKTLSEEQMIYAATDAWICLKISAALL